MMLYIIIINIIIPYLRAEPTFQRPFTKTAKIRKRKHKRIKKTNDVLLTKQMQRNPSSKADSSSAISNNSTLL